MPELCDTIADEHRTKLHDTWTRTINTGNECGIAICRDMSATSICTGDPHHIPSSESRELKEQCPSGEWWSFIHTHPPKMDYDEDENVVHLIPKEVTYRFNSNFSGRDIAGAFQEGLDNACILYPWSMDEPEKPGLKCVPVTSNASAERLRDISVGIAEQEKSEQVTPNDYAMFWGGLDEMGQCEVEL